MSAAALKQLRTSLAAAGRPAEVFTCPGTAHWFFESDRAEDYDATAASLAWERSVAFLQRHLGREPGCRR